MKKILIVGAGFSGAVVARQLADITDAVIDIIDSREHLGGNCHTQRDEATGITVHNYGPHIFNTDHKHVWDYISQFTEMRPFVNRVKTSISKGVFSLPINLHTINQFFGLRLDPSEAKKFVEDLGDISIINPSNFEEQALRFLGRDLYDAFFSGYTRKQWGCEPKELPASILKRLPIRFNYDDNYYNVKFQGIPLDGYTPIFERMLAHPRINISLGTSLSKDMMKSYDHIFYTGPIDAYFDYEYGRLRYRTVTFERSDHVGDFQGNAVINYPDPEVPYTRVHEHKHFTPWENHEKTVVFREYSKATEPEDTPYYPLRLEADMKMLELYTAAASRVPNVTFLGRLATYRYLDMDDVIDEALTVAKNFIEVE